VHERRSSPTLERLIGEDEPSFPIIAVPTVVWRRQPDTPRFICSRVSGAIRVIDVRFEGRGGDPMATDEMPNQWYEDYQRGRPGYPEAVLELVDLAPTATVLDLAAGTGKFTRQLASRFPQVVAVEPDDGMRRVLAASCPEAEALKGSAHRLPVADASICVSSRDLAPVVGADVGPSLGSDWYLVRAAAERSVASCPWDVTNRVGQQPVVRGAGRPRE